MPFVDRVRATIDLREQVISFPPQPVITADNLQVGIDTVVYFQVTDPRLAVYGIANYITGMEQLTTTTLRNVVGGLNLEGALTGRDGINSQLREVLDGTTGPWGLRVARVEIKAIDPPPSIQDSMEKQMRADRDKRAIDPHRRGPAAVGDHDRRGPEGRAILSAEGHKQPRRSWRPRPSGRAGSCAPRVSGPRSSCRRRARPSRSRRCSRPSTTASPTRACWPTSTCRRCRKIAQGDANKMWIVPSEFSKALEGLANLGGAGRGAGRTASRAGPGWTSTPRGPTPPPRRPSSWTPPTGSSPRCPGRPTSPRPRSR